MRIVTTAALLGLLLISNAWAQTRPRLRPIRGFCRLEQHLSRAVH